MPIEAAVADDGDPVVSAAVAGQQFCDKTLGAGRPQFGGLKGLQPPALVVQVVGQDKVGKVGLKVGPVLSRQAVPLIGFAVRLVDPAHLVSIDPGHQGQAQGPGDDGAGLHGAQHKAAIEMGQAKTVDILGRPATVDLGRGAVAVAAKDGGALEKKGQDFSLLPAGLGQAGVGAAALGRTVLDPEAVVFRLSVADDIQLHIMKPPKLASISW